MNGSPYDLKKERVCDRMALDGDRKKQSADGFVRYDLPTGGRSRRR